VAVAVDKGVAVGGGRGVEVAGTAVGGSAVRVGRLRKLAARAVGVAVAAGAQALKKRPKQIIKIAAEKNLLLFIAIPVFFSL
jgi:hypothetical protein